MPGRSTSPSRTRSGRSASPSRMRGRSSSPSRMRGRSGSPSRARGRSGSPSRMRGRSGSPSRMRGRSSSPSRMRGRSSSPSQMRGRSSSPSRMRGRSSSPSRMRGRSSSPSRMRGRSKSPSREATRGKSSSPSRQKGGKDRRKGLRATYNRSSRRLGRGMRRIASRESCGIWKMLSYLIPIVLLLASTAGLIVVTGNTPGVFKELIPTFKNEDLVDPFSAQAGGTGGAKWKNDGNGLELELLNALSPSWDLFFSLAVADWNFGNPDAVSLTAQKVKEEKECTAVTGKVKVCNGDYGDVKWRGINVASYDSDGFIISGAARMNEFYLEFDGEDAKQYTMCHELGHSLGLLHTDENFGNEDLGNCLDYTENFDVNKHPDVSNYEALLSMYGPVGGRRLRGKSPSFKRRLSRHAMDEIHEAVEKFLVGFENAHLDGWELLHRSRYGEDHLLSFDEGHSVRVHMLLA